MVKHVYIPRAISQLSEPYDGLAAPRGTPR